MDNYFKDVEEKIEKIKKYEEERKVAFWKNLPFYIWAIFTDFIAVFVVIAIFGFAYDTSETIIFSILILIYINVVGFNGIYGQMETKEVLVLNEEFKRLRKLLKEDVSEDDKIFEEEDLNNVREKVRQAEIKFYIHGIFSFLIYLIVLWNLLSALF